MEGTYARTDETLPARIDALTGGIFRSRASANPNLGWRNIPGKIARFGDRNNLFVAMSLIGAYEQQKEVAPEGIF